MLLQLTIAFCIIASIYYMEQNQETSTYTKLAAGGAALVLFPINMFNRYRKKQGEARKQVIKEVEVIIYFKTMIFLFIFNKDLDSIFTFHQFLYQLMHLGTR